MPKTGGTESTLTGGYTTMVIMPRRFMRRMRRPLMAPIVSYKHQRQEVATYTGVVANHENQLFVGLAPGSAEAPQTAIAGHKVYSVDISLTFVQTSSSGNSPISWMLVHTRDGQDIDSCFAATDASNWSNIGLSKCRNQVIKSFLSAVGSNDAGPKQWNLHIKIPKMWHRIREGDRLILVFNGQEPGLLAIGTRFKSYS